MSSLSCDDEALELTGTVERVVYRSDESGYTVAVLRSDKVNEDVTFVGTCAAIWEGEQVRVQGKWDKHSKHGRQFSADQIECEQPVTTKGITRFLSSGLIRGVGKVMADRLIDSFGDTVLTVIDEQPERLQEVSGIGKAKVRQIVESWEEQKAVRGIMVFLHGHGIGLAQSMRIYKTYGADAVAVVTSNPYALCRDVWGIGFSTADRIGKSLGIPENSIVRVRAGLHYVLETLADEGHCCVEHPDLIAATVNVLSVDESIAVDALEGEVSNESLVQEKSLVYLKGLHAAELSVASNLERLCSPPVAIGSIDVPKALKWVSKKMEMTFAESQIAALQMAIESKVSVITGGPGVGKTTIVRALVEVMKAKSLSIVLAAPTGRAAKRMEESAGMSAVTIHRLLRFLPHLNRFECDEDTPVEGDVFIIDESSMIDIKLMASLLCALPSHAHIVLVGDIDQLPSVGPGNVLRDVLSSDTVPSVRLDTIYRQAARSSIVENAHRVNHGESLELPQGDSLHDFYFVAVDDPDLAVEKLVNLVTERIPQRFQLDPRTDIQVLSPMRRGQHGIENLNTVLQAVINPSLISVKRFGRDYREGDRVMQIRNNYDKDVYNGDIGSISRIDSDNDIVDVLFGQRSVRYENRELDELVLSYASTIHKSQGSEYPAVVILITTSHYKMLKRNLLYTGITRGRQLVCVVGSRRAVDMAIANNDVLERRTTLSARLCARFSGN